MKEKHVVIDACCLGRRKTGNETYVRGLLAGLAEVAPPHWSFTVLVTSAYTGARQPRFRWQEIPLGNFWTRNFLVIPQALNRLRPDLYHGIYWTRFFSMPVPVVLMVHDLSFVSFPQGFHKHEQIIYSHFVRASARSAHHLLTVSHFSKAELIKHWRVPPEKITVTYDGLDDGFQPQMEGGSSAQSSYILYVGNLHPRKNLVRLLEAFVELKNTLKLPHRLKIVGQQAWMAGEVFSKVRQTGLEGEVDFTGYVSYEELVGLYQRAAVAVYPSLYEGFGLPVLEAMACGCPVVCSNTTSIPEVAGDACILVDPRSSPAIAAGIRSVLEDPELGQSLRQKGLKQAMRFRWRDCAQATLEAYEKVLSPLSQSL